MLVDPQLGTSINAADVTIDASQVTIDYTTSASSLIEVGNDIAVVVMFYKKIADDYPEVGDLLILARSHPGGTPTKFSCRKSWISNLDGNDANAIGDVVGNVIETSSSS